MQPSGPAERVESGVSGIDSRARQQALEGRGRRVVGGLMHEPGCGRGVVAGQRGQRGRGPVRVEHYVAGQDQPVGQQPQLHVGVGEGRLGAAPAEGGRAWNGTGTGRPHRHRPRTVRGGDRRASEADRDDPGHGQRHRNTPDLRFRVHIVGSVPHQSEVEGGAAHVEGDHGRVAVPAGQDGRQPQPGGRS